MEGLRRGVFVGEDRLDIEEDQESDPRLVLIEGEIGCLVRIVVSVLKTLEVLDGEGLDATVQTVTYSYNVSIRPGHNLFRYDNLHSRRGHPDDHHKHLFDWRTGEELPESPKWIGANGWPTLTEEVIEAERWYWDHRDELEAPDSFPELQVRE